MCRALAAWPPCGGPPDGPEGVIPSPHGMMTSGLREAKCQPEVIQLSGVEQEFEPRLAASMLHCWTKFIMLLRIYSSNFYSSAKP